MFTKLRASTDRSHARAQAVLLGLDQAIGQQTGQGSSPVLYLGALLLGLTQYEQQPSHTVAAMLHILSLLIPELPKAVVRAKFDEISILLGNVLQTQAEHAAITNAVLKTIGHSLKHLSPGQWNVTNQHPLRLLQGLLVFSVDPRPSVRHASRKALMANVEQLSQQASVPKHVSSAITRFSVRELAQADAKDCQVVLLLCGVLQPLLIYLPATNCASILEPLLALCSSGNVHLLIQIFKTLECLFKAAASGASGNPRSHLQLIAQLLESLVSLTPHMADTQAMSAYHAVITTGLTSLTELDVSLAGPLFRPLFFKVADCLLSTKNSVVTSSAKTLKQLVTLGFSGPMIAWSAQNFQQQMADADLPPPLMILSFGTQLLDYKYKQIWTKCFAVLRHILEALPAPLPPIILARVQTLLLAMDALHSAETEFTSSLEEAVSGGVKSLGLPVFLSILPLDLPMERSEDTPMTTMLARSRAWLLPLFKLHVESSHLDYFRSSLLPQCEALTKMAQDAQDDLRPVESMTLLKIQEQIWNVFPSLCIKPVDGDVAFKKLARKLGGLLGASEEQKFAAACNQPVHLTHEQIIVCRGLRSFIRTNQDVDDDTDEKQAAFHQKCLGIVAGFAKNFLPLCFNLLTMIGDKRESVLGLVSAFAHIANPRLVNAQFQACLKKFLQSSGQDPKMAARLVDIMCELCECKEIVEGNISLAYQAACPLIQQTKNATLQKKGYKLVAALLKASPVLINNWESTIQEMSSTTKSAVPSSLPARTQCLLYLLPAVSRAQPDQCGRFLPGFLPELILANNETSRRARDNASSVLIELAKTMLDNPQFSLAQFVCLVLGMLAGVSDHMQAGTVLSLARLLYEFRTQLDQETISGIMQVVLPLFKRRSKEILKAVIGLCKVVSLSLDVDRLTGCLADLVRGLCVHSTDEKKTFRSKIKGVLQVLIERVGYEAIAPHIPPSHARQLEHLRRQHARDQRDKADRQNRRRQARSGARNDADEEEEDDRTHRPRSSKTNRELSYEDILYGDEDEEDGQKMEEDGDGESKMWIRDDDVDFLDGSSAVRSVVSSNPSALSVNRAASLGHFAMDETGRLQITEEGITDVKSTVSTLMELDESDMTGREARTMRRALGAAKVPKAKQTEQQQAQPQRKKKRGRDDNAPAASQEAGTTWNTGGFRKKVKSRDGMKRDVTGQGFRTAKAGGDMKKGRFDPFAWYQLDPKDMNRRNRGKADRRFTSVVNTVGQKNSGSGSGGNKGRTLNKKARAARRKRQAGGHR